MYILLKKYYNMTDDFEICRSILMICYHCPFIDICYKDHDWLGK